MIRPCRFRRHRKILKAQWLPILHFVTFGMNGKLKRAKGGWRRVEEGERKRGWRKRKEENGVQAHNRAEIILDHKGWNSIENLGYSKNCQSIVEKGKRPDEQDVGVEGQVQVLTAWPEKKRRVNDTLSLIFFLKNTSSPVNVMEKWRTAGRCWKENSYAKMRSWRELKKNWNVLRMTLFLYP